MPGWRRFASVEYLPVLMLLLVPVLWGSGALDLAAMRAQVPVAVTVTACRTADVKTPKGWCEGSWTMPDGRTHTGEVTGGAEHAAGGTRPGWATEDGATLDRDRDREDVLYYKFGAGGLIAAAALFAYFRNRARERRVRGGRRHPNPSTRRSTRGRSSSE